MSQTRKRAIGGWACGFGIAALAAAGVVVARVAAVPAGGPAQTASARADQAELQLQAARNKQVVEGKLDEAIRLYREVVSKFPQNRALVARALVGLGQCYEKLGASQSAEARKAYEQIVREYADQADAVNQARARLAALAPQPGPAPSAAPGTLRRVYEGEVRGTPIWISPDGRFLVLRVGSIARWRSLIVRNLSTGEERVIAPTDPPAGVVVSDGSVSPDGTQIAYGIVTYGAQPLPSTVELRVTSADAAGSRLLAKSSDLSWRWTPDSKRLQVVSIPQDRATIEILSISVADGTVTRAAIVPRTTRGVESLLRGGGVSPDGRYVALNDMLGGQFGVSVVDLTSGAATRVTDAGRDSLGLGWTPDGSGIVFQSDRSGARALWLVRLVNGRPAGPPEMIKDNLGDPIDNFAVGFTDDGTFYYSETESVRERYLARLDPSTGRVVGAPTKFFIQDPQSGCGWDWSPDGTSIVYAATLLREPGGPRTSCSFLVVRSMADGRERVLPSEFSEVYFTRWSPDGRSLLVYGKNDDVLGAYLVDIATGTTTLVARNTTNPVDRQDYGLVPDWSPDGRGVFLGRYEAGKSRIVYRDLETGAETERYSVAAPRRIWFSVNSVARDGSVCVLESAPDGSHPAVFIPADGQPAKVVHKAAPPNTISAAACSTDGKGVWVTQRRATPEDPDARRLLLVPVDGGEAKDSGLTITGLDGVRQSPDGTRLLLQGVRATTTLWAVERLLPRHTVGAASSAAAPSSVRVERQVLSVQTPAVDEPALSVRVSADGRILVFPSVDPSAPGLVIQDAASGARRVIGGADAAGGTVESPTLSPDGRRVAYTWVAIDGRSVLTRISNADGSNPRTLRTWSPTGPAGQNRQQAVTVTPPWWSQDGTHVLVADAMGEQSASLRWIAADGGPDRPVRARVDLASMRGPLQLSPDGRFAVIQSGEGLGPNPGPGGNSRLSVVDLETGTQEPLAGGATDATAPAWLADSQGVVYLRTKAGSQGLWLQRLAKGTPQGTPGLIGANYGFIQPLFVSRQGVLFYRSRIQSKATGTYVSTLDTATGRPIGLPRHVAIRETPEPRITPARDWSPDGQSFVYTSKPVSGPGSASPAASLLVIQSIADGQERVLTPGLTSISMPRWSPDGQFIVVSGTKEDDKAATGLWRVDASTGRASLVVPGVSGARDWSPDGKGLYLSKRDNTAATLVYRDLESGTERELLRTAQPVVPGNPCVSPDGSQLAVLLSDSFSAFKELKVLPAAGGDARTILSGFNDDISGIGACWSSDGKALHVVRGRNLGGWIWRGSGAAASLWKVPVDGSAPMPTGLAQEGLVNPRMSPDNSRVLFDGQYNTYEVWAVENFLPASPKTPASKK